VVRRTSDLNLVDVEIAFNIFGGCQLITKFFAESLYAAANPFDIITNFWFVSDMLRYQKVTKPIESILQYR